MSKEFWIYFALSVTAADEEEADKIAMSIRKSIMENEYKVSIHDVDVEEA